ncbi:MAG: ribosomal L7Ae/L30e/S12e/Gadd45 family protein [Bacillota bacterium]|nr:ribosomal L7Ae/L30e/S12e/Gadd45 family protein [Bacillota bacterium]
MSLEVLRNPRLRVIGLKQTTKAVERGQARTVYLAGDADERLVRDLVSKCRERGIELVRVESMAALGKACGIDVGAAAAALVRSE